MSKHPFVIRTYKGKEVEIDIEIAPLIDKLWELGVETTYCCQGGGDEGNYPGGYVSMTMPGFTKLIETIGLTALMSCSSRIEYGRASFKGDVVVIRFHNDQLPLFTKLVVGETGETTA